MTDGLSAKSGEAGARAAVGDPSALRLCIEPDLPQCAPTGQSPWAKGRGTASAMITPGEAATIPAELAMPDLDLIKQVEQGCRTGAGGWHRVIPPGPARLVVDTFVRAIETSYFERRLQPVEADHFNQPDEAAGMYGGTPNGYYYNP